MDRSRKPRNVAFRSMLTPAERPLGPGTFPGCHNEAGSSALESESVPLLRPADREDQDPGADRPAHLFQPELPAPAAAARTVIVITMGDD
jgi:hypothetical protein